MVAPIISASSFMMMVDDDNDDDCSNPARPRKCARALLRERVLKIYIGILLLHYP